MEYAGVAHRFVAVLIDGVVFVALALLIALLSGGAYSNTSNGTHNFGVEAGNRATLVALLVFFAYYVICEAVFGKTIGKRLTGLRVVDEDGDHIGFGASLVRNLLRIVDGLFFYFVAAVAAWSSAKRQRLGDRAAHTFVVRDWGEHTAGARLTPTVSEQPPHGATGRGVATYTEDDFMGDLARARRFSASHSD